MVREEIADLLKRTMGMDAAAIGPSAIDRAVQDRRSALKFTDEEAYLNHLRVSESELTELIEAVVVPETWFFRHHEAFDEVARIALEEWLPAHATGVLRVLSLPCSTGEEPYSIAMALLDAGLHFSRFQIEAIDISERALALARRAEYGKNSFRGSHLGFRDRHFTPAQGRWQLSDHARLPVRFQQGNLFAGDFLPGVDLFDIIFCRNLLIYFDRPAQDHAVSTLRRLLRTRGTLFVGPSETSLVLSHDFESAKVPRAFAFHKRAAVTGVAVSRPADPVKRAAKPRPHPAARSATPAAALLDKPRPIRPSTAPKSTPESEIGEAASLADQGRLAEAERSCKEHIRKHGASAQAFYLLGLIRDAGGDAAEAGQYYRKALYLDQNHQEALSQLALLLRKQGDTAGARVLQDRMSRTRRERAT